MYRAKKLKEVCQLYSYALIQSHLLAPIDRNSEHGLKDRMNSKEKALAVYKV
jgi:hypothetical protein